MGADRYTTCPKCVHEYDDAMDKLADEIRAEYPKLSQAAQETLVPVLAEERGLKQPNQTFREDYEFAHGDNDPTVQVEYKGRCSECGLELKISEEHTIWDGEGQ